MTHRMFFYVLWHDKTWSAEPIEFTTHFSENDRYAERWSQDALRKKLQSCEDFLLVGPRYYPDEEAYEQPIPECLSRGSETLSREGT